jgi:hypothetical protein
VTVAERRGGALGGDEIARFQEAFALPFATALPDFTFPARRDSHYRASLRQWRIAESVELGLVRTPDSSELASGLAALYGDAPPGDSARWRSTPRLSEMFPAYA